MTEPSKNARPINLRRAMLALTARDADRQRPTLPDFGSFGRAVPWARKPVQPLLRDMASLGVAKNYGVEEDCILLIRMPKHLGRSFLAPSCRTTAVL